MIKTQTESESKFLRRIMPHYYAYLVKNPNTTLTHFYGMFRVKMNHLRRNVHFVIMKSGESGTSSSVIYVRRHR
jgi:1-phosphatidylinositol-4-phosphate 5-kinase